MELPLNQADIYHVGIVVEDLAAAKAEYTRTLGVTWGFSSQSLPEGAPGGMPVLFRDECRTLDIQFAYSQQGPVYFELVQMIPDTIFTVEIPGHAHHVGYWCDDIAGVSAALTRAGVPWIARLGVSTEAERAYAVIHRTPDGLNVELVDRAMREHMFGAPEHPVV